MREGGPRHPVPCTLPLTPRGRDKRGGEDEAHVQIEDPAVAEVEVEKEKKMEK